MYMLSKAAYLLLTLSIIFCGLTEQKNTKSLASALKWNQFIYSLLKTGFNTRQQMTHFSLKDAEQTARA